MHQLECECGQCRQRAGAGFEVLELGAGPALFGEQQELELALELLAVSNEAALDQFLGKVFKSVWKGVKKIAKPLGGVLKAVAKTALPFVGGALGSMMPIAGVGTALGSALGRARPASGAACCLPPFIPTTRSPTRAWRASSPPTRTICPALRSSMRGATGAA